MDRVEWRRVTSLSRLAVLGAEPTNAESIFISRMLRMLRTEGRWVAAVTFADSSQGHTGVIYRASNWIYVGATRPEPRWVDGEGRQVSRLATRSRTAAQMLDLGYVLAGRYSKHKFVYRLQPERVSQQDCAGHVLD